MIAELEFTPAQLYGVIAVLVFLLGVILLFKKVFDFASPADLKALDASIKLEMEKHSNARHEMRHEITSLKVALVKVETLLEGLPDKIRRTNDERKL